MAWPSRTMVSPRWAWAGARSGSSRRASRYEDRASVYFSIARRALPRLWCKAAMSGWSRTASWQCGIASSAWPRSSSIWPRLVRAGAKFGSSSTARRKCIQRVVHLAEVPQHDPQVVVRRGELGPQFQRPLEMADGLRLLPQPLQRQPQVAQGLGIVRPQAQRRPAAAGRPLELPDRPVRLRQVGVERRHVRPQRHRPADQLDGPRVVAALMVQHPQQVQRHRVLLLLRQDPLI